MKRHVSILILVFFGIGCVVGLGFERWRIKKQEFQNMIINKNMRMIMLISVLDSLESDHVDQAKDDLESALDVSILGLNTWINTPGVVGEAARSGLKQAALHRKKFPYNSKDQGIQLRVNSALAPFL